MVGIGMASRERGPGPTGEEYPCTAAVSGTRLLRGACASDGGRTCGNGSRDVVCLLRQTCVCGARQSLTLRAREQQA